MSFWSTFDDTLNVNLNLQSSIESTETNIWTCSELLNIKQVMSNKINFDKLAGCLIRIYSDIHQRSQTSYTPLCNGIVSHGAHFGGLQVFANRHKNKRKTNAFTIFVWHATFFVFYHPRQQQMLCLCTWPWLTYILKPCSYRSNKETIPCFLYIC